MKKTYKEISPFLTIYKPQAGSIISIIERISGIFLIDAFFLYLIILYLKESCLINYSLYQILFFFFVSDSVLGECILLFLLINFAYHVFFLPILYKRKRALMGEINNYHTMQNLDLLENTLVSALVLVLVVVVLYLGLWVYLPRSIW